MRCRRKDVDRGSNCTNAMRRPSSLMRSRASSPHTPDVSMATGVKSICGGISEYLFRFFNSAAAAAAPADTLED